MNHILKKQIERTLALTFTEFKNEKEVANFLKDFLTIKELETLSKRLSVAYWLTKKRNYANIQNNLKVSSATIAVGKDLLKKDSIRKALKRVDADEWADKWSIKIKKLWY
jgi:uncharacterized protein YerC